MGCLGFGFQGGVVVDEVVEIGQLVQVIVFDVADIYVCNCGCVFVCNCGGGQYVWVLLLGIMLSW